MGYTKNAITGFSWQMGLKLSTNLITLVKVAILARLISPTEYGLFSLTIVAIGLTEAFTDTGVNVTIVQSDKSTRHFLNSAWVISMARGLLIALVMVILGIFMSTHFKQPELKSLVWLAALIPIIRGFINPYVINWYKELEFDRDTWYRFALYASEAIIAVLLGLWLRSALALVGAIIGSALIEVLISFTLIKIRPKFQFEKNTASQIVGSAKKLSITAGLNYLNDNLDNLMVGQILGAYKLGLYHNAYGLSHKANYELAKGAFHSLFPVFSRVKNEPERLGRAFKKSSLTMAILTVMTSLPLILFPQLVVQIILGQEWLAIVPIVPWLTLAGWLQGIGQIVYSGWLAQKNFNKLNCHLLVNLILMVFFIWWLGGSLGLLGLGWALVLTRLVALPIVLLGAFNLTRNYDAQSAN